MWTTTAECLAPLPLALKEKVETELGKLESMGIISQVQFSRWAAPIVHVLKQNGTVRICGDFKVTVNQACQTDSYPPQVDELLISLVGSISQNWTCHKHTCNYHWITSQESMSQ